MFQKQRYYYTFLLKRSMHPEGCQMHFLEYLLYDDRGCIKLHLCIRFVPIITLIVSEKVGEFSLRRLRNPQSSFLDN